MALLSLFTLATLWLSGLCAVAGEIGGMVGWFLLAVVLAFGWAVWAARPRP